MSDKRKNQDLLNLNVNLDAIAAAARNAENLDSIALEVKTVNPSKLTLDQRVYTLKIVPANDKMASKGKKKEFVPKVVGVKSFVIDSLANVKEGMVTINSTIDIPKTGNKVVKPEEALFESEDDAREVGRVLTEIEIEKTQQYIDDYNEAINFMKKQIDDDRI